VVMSSADTNAVGTGLRVGRFGKRKPDTDQPGPLANEAMKSKSKSRWSQPFARWQGVMSAFSISTARCARRQGRQTEFKKTLYSGAGTQTGAINGSFAPGHRSDDFGGGFEITVE